MYHPLSSLYLPVDDQPWRDSIDEGHWLRLDAFIGKGSSRDPAQGPELLVLLADILLLSARDEM